MAGSRPSIANGLIPDDPEAERLTIRQESSLGSEDSIDSSARFRSKWSRTAPSRLTALPTRAPKTSKLSATVRVASGA